MIAKIKHHITAEGFKKYFRNSAWLIGDKFIRLIAGVFVGVYVTRYLGPVQYGILSYALSFVAMFAVIAPLGLDSILINKLVRNPEKGEQILGTAFLLKLAGALLTILLIAATFLFNFNDNLSNIYILIIAFGLIFQPFNVIDLYFQSKVQAKYTVQAQLISLTITSITRLILVFVKAPLVYFVWVTLLDSSVVAIGLLLQYKKQHLKITGWGFNVSTGTDMLKQSWPLIFSGLSIMIYMRIDQIMIKEILGFKSVGIFSVAVTLTELWYFIPVALGSSFFPALINSKLISEDLFKSRLSNLLSMMVILALLISIPTLFISEFIITTLYGNAFLAAAKILNVYIWGTVFVFLGVVSSKWFIIENLNTITLYRSVMGAVVNVILNLILIPKYGILGAAIATVFSQMMQVYFSNLFFQKTRKLFVLQSRCLFLIHPATLLYNTIRSK